MTALRLLPWPSPEGKPCYLATGEEGGFLSRLADQLEEVQLTTGAEVLHLARTVLDDPASPYTEVRFAGIRLAECLTDALRVAESRGLRLPAPAPADTEKPGEHHHDEPDEPDESARDPATPTDTGHTAEPKPRPAADDATPRAPGGSGP